MLGGHFGQHCNLLHQSCGSIGDYYDDQSGGDKMMSFGNGCYWIEQYTVITPNTNNTNSTILNHSNILQNHHLVGQSHCQHGYDLLDNRLNHKRKLDSMEDEDNHDVHTPAVSVLEDNDLFREVKRVKTSLTLQPTHLQVCDASMQQDQDTACKYDVGENHIICQNLKNPKSPPKTKTNSEKSLLSSDANQMVREIWRKKLSSLISQSTGGSHLPNPKFDGSQLNDDFDKEEQEGKAIIPFNIARDDKRLRTDSWTKKKTRIDSTSNGFHQRKYQLMDDPHSTGLADNQYEMSDE